MKQNDIIKEIGQIRSLMERSSKFISISGLSGVLIGVYALLGALAGYLTVYGFQSQFGYRDYYVTDSGVVLKLVFIAGLVLLASLCTGWWMARQKAKRVGQSVWNQASRSLLWAVAVPLVTGGVLSCMLIWRGEYGFIASTLLIFYGMALCAGSTFTFKEVRWLGIMEILLGLITLAFPGYGLWFWAVGFGVLHIVYGIIVHKRYEK
ncbi:MAG TPA: hypothetical protein PKA53_10410 [Sphingobacterium sp.]|nr:hypothetical protein [Sphingobacterium sp.]